MLWVLPEDNSGDNLGDGIFFDHDPQVLEQENSYLSTVLFLSERREIRIKPKLRKSQICRHSLFLRCHGSYGSVDDHTVISKAAPLQNPRARQP